MSVDNFVISMALFYPSHIWQTLFHYLLTKTQPKLLDGVQELQTRLTKLWKILIAFISFSNLQQLEHLFVYLFIGGENSLNHI